MTERIGILEDVGKSVLICDHCETMFSKLDRRYHDGDECPTCRDGQDAPDVLATAQVWADGGQADAVANMARAFVGIRRERDELLETMRKLTREQAEIVAASVQNDNALAAGYRDDCTRALTTQAMEVLAAVRKAPRFYPSQSTDGWFIMREEEEELPGEWVNVDALLEALRQMLLTNAEPGGTR